MKIKTLFNENEDINIKSYLGRNNITDVDLFLKPNKKCLDKVENYCNMKEVYEILKEVIENE